jgi:hypothetical protein
MIEKLWLEEGSPPGNASIPNDVQVWGAQSESAITKPWQLCV